MPEKTGTKQGKRNPDGTFKKGVTGNPAGRPKGRKNFTTKVREAMEKIGDELNTDVELQLGKVITKKALEGDHQMIKLVWEYFDGKPQQFIDHTTDGEKIDSGTLGFHNASELSDLKDEYEQKIKEQFSKKQ